MIVFKNEKTKTDVKLKAGFLVLFIFIIIYLLKVKYGLKLSGNLCLQSET